jgi:hypothetical protein
MDLGNTEDAQRERKMSALSTFPLLKVMNLLIVLNFFEGAQGAQHSHWGSGVITFSGTSQALESPAISKRSNENFADSA